MISKNYFFLLKLCLLVLICQIDSWVIEEQATAKCISPIYGNLKIKEYSFGKWRSVINFDIRYIKSFVGFYRILKGILFLGGLRFSPSEL